MARAISGDNSDNLKGVPGVGLETLHKRFPIREKVVTLKLFSVIVRKC